MKLAVGPLTSGTYMCHAVTHQGKYYGHKDVEGTKLALVEDKEHEGIKWKIEKVGENRFKAWNSSSNAAVSFDPVDKQTVTIETTGEATEWIVEPTDVDGEYIGQPAHDKSVFATATQDEATVKMGPQSEMTRFNVYRVDDD